jgi:hypothetical protein
VFLCCFWNSVSASFFLSIFTCSCYQNVFTLHSKNWLSIFKFVWAGEKDSTYISPELSIGLCLKYQHFENLVHYWNQVLSLFGACFLADFWISKRHCFVAVGFLYGVFGFMCVYMYLKHTCFRKDDLLEHTDFLKEEKSNKRNRLLHNLLAKLVNHNFG